VCGVSFCCGLLPSRGQTSLLRPGRKHATDLIFHRLIDGAVSGFDGRQGRCLPQASPHTQRTSPPRQPRLLLECHPQQQLHGIDRSAHANGMEDVCRPAGARFCRTCSSLLSNSLCVHARDAVVSPSPWVPALHHDRRRRECAFVTLKSARYPLGCRHISGDREHIETPRSMKLRHKRSCRVVARYATSWAAARLKPQARSLRPKRRNFSEQSSGLRWLRGLTKDSRFRVVADPATDVSQLKDYDDDFIEFVSNGRLRRRCRWRRRSHCSPQRSQWVSELYQ